MKKKESQEKTDLLFGEIFGSPLEIPISFNDVKLGDVIVDYKVDKNLLSDTKLREKMGYLNVIVTAELMYLSELLQKDIEFAITIDERYREKKIKFAHLMNLFLISSEHQYNPALYILWNDNEIFEWINSEGPISLRHSITQMMLNIWTSSGKNIIGRRINKLRNSLMEYALGTSYENKLIKTGRPEIEHLKFIGTEWIKNMYQEVTSILKIAKKIRKANSSEEISELIDKAFDRYIDSLIQEIVQKGLTEERQDKLIRLQRGLKGIRDTKVSNPISECIESEEYMTTQFNSLSWEPNYLAKEIIAKLLNISVNKVESILYRT
jgi:hypothetical protein